MPTVCLEITRKYLLLLGMAKILAENVRDVASNEYIHHNGPRLRRHDI